MTQTTSTRDAAQVTLREVEPGDTETCARIVFDAFGAIHDHHRFPRDFPVPEAAAGMMGMWIPHPDVWGVVAEVEGRIVGSNFLDERDSIRGVGPITVDPEGQNAGVGRRLMEAVLERGKDASGIRLVQDGFHMRSLSLYTSLGFDVTASCVLMSGEPRGSAVEGVEVRPLTEDDLEECDALCKAVHGFARAGALRDSLAAFAPFAAVRDVLADGIRSGRGRGGNEGAASGSGRGRAPRAARAAPIRAVSVVSRAGSAGRQADERDGPRRVPGAARILVSVSALLGDTLPSGYLVSLQGDGRALGPV